MLANSRQIIKEVNHKTNLEQALGIIVEKSKSAMDAAACSIYLKETGTDQYLLMAADGLIPTVIGAARFRHNQGLVGWIAAHEEAINLSNAADHHSFRSILETGNGSMHGFMGAPIIHHSRVLGVLVAQKKELRRFDNDEAAFFTTLATQLAEPINRLLATWDFSRNLNGPAQGRLLIRGIPGSPGVALGNIKLSQPSDLQSTPDGIAKNIDAEIASFQAAVAATEKELSASCERMSAYLPGEILPMFDAYAMMLRSDKLVAATITRIRDGQWARGALRDTILELAHLFDQIEDPYLAARAEDMRNIGRQILLHLLGKEAVFGGYPKQCILAGVELSLSEISNVPKDKLSGIICTQGSVLSHTAIICRALGIPAVMGLTDFPMSYLEGRRIAVDGNQGVVCINPLPADINKYRQRMREENAMAAQLQALGDLPPETQDGVPMTLHVNLGIDADDIPSRSEKYDGVGLYRTEFSFIARDTLPTEDEQYALYRNLLESFTSKPVTIRSLDAGGDKELPFFSIAETNPFLGWRGIRFTLDHPEIFMTQLRALLRANAGLNNLRVLFPMISRVSEIDNTLDLLERAYSDLLAEGQAAAKPQIGAMIEVPSAVYLIPALSQRVDFFSIGTNDLTQYLLAVDRNNPRVQGGYDNLHPAVVHVITDIIQRARRHNKPVGVCGEMAGNPASALLLIGLGVDSLSMTPTSLPRIKWTLRSFTRQKMKDLSEQILKIENEKETHQLLNQALSNAGLSALVDTNF